MSNTDKELDEIRGILDELRARILDEGSIPKRSQLVDELEEQSYKRGFKEAEQWYREHQNQLLDKLLEELPESRALYHNPPAQNGDWYDSGFNAYRTQVVEAINKLRAGIDCYCDGGDIPHHHLLDDGKSHDIRPDISKLRSNK